MKILIKIIYQSKHLIFTMKKINLLLAIIALIISACSSEDTPRIDLGTTPENFPVIDGSDSTEPLRRILLCKLLGYGYKWEEYPLNMPERPDAGPRSVRINFDCTPKQEEHLDKECLLRNNTHRSFINLIDDKVELILTARSISRDEKAYADEQNVSLIEKPIAKDALTFIVNHQNPVQNLSIQQIQDIYTGKITNWKEVGGEDAKLQPYVRNRNSGSQEKFEMMVMKDLDIINLPEMYIGQSMMSPYFMIEADRNGLCFTPFYYYSVMVGNKWARAIGVNGAAMTRKNIMNGSYPYTSDIYAAVRSDIDRSSMAYSIFEFLTTEQGQAVVEESGYIPLSQYRPRK